MIKINGAEYRNLPQQVAKNANDIAELQKYTNLYTTHCVKLSGSTYDSEAQTTAVWTLTAYHKMPVDDVKSWSQWIQDALDAGTYSIDSMLYYSQDNLTPMTQFSYGVDTEVSGQINCQGIVIGTQDECRFSINTGDFDLENEFEIQEVLI